MEGIGGHNDVPWSDLSEALQARETMKSLVETKKRTRGRFAAIPVSGEP